MDKNKPGKADPYAPQLLAMRRDEGLSFRDMESAMNARHKVRLSYRTIQKWFHAHHPKLTAQRDTAASTDAISSSPSSSTHTMDSEAPASPPAEDLATLRAQLEALTRAHRALQDRNTAQQAEIIALTEQRPTLEVQPMPSPGLPAPGYGLLPYEEPWPAPTPEGDDPAVPLRRTAWRWGVLGLVVLLACHTAWLLLTHGSAVTEALIYHITRAPHAPLVLVEFAIVLAGLALGARARILALVPLVGLIYLAYLRTWPIPFVVLLFLTLHVAAPCLRPRP